jgi:hypothetical protein
MKGSIMPQSEHALAWCRLVKDGKLGFASFNACAFEFPRCDGCPNASRSVSTVRAVEDPINSVILSGWLHGELQGPG